ncbi:MAG: hypothetical protein AAF439_08630, partial [Pseudomonadota bacterium]
DAFGQIGNVANVEWVLPIFQFHTFSEDDMAETGKRVEVRFGAFTCSIEGYDDPVEQMRDILGMMQKMIAETPALTEAGDFDAKEVQDALDERGDDTPQPGVVVIRQAAEEAPEPAASEEIETAEEVTADEGSMDGAPVAETAFENRAVAEATADSTDDASVGESNDADVEFGETEPPKPTDDFSATDDSAAMKTPAGDVSPESEPVAREQQTDEDENATLGAAAAVATGLGAAAALAASDDAGVEDRTTLAASEKVAEPTEEPPVATTSLIETVEETVDTSVDDDTTDDEIAFNLFADPDDDEVASASEADQEMEDEESFSLFAAPPEETTEPDEAGDTASQPQPSIETEPEREPYHPTSVAATEPEETSTLSEVAEAGNDAGGFDSIFADSAAEESASESGEAVSHAPVSDEAPDDDYGHSSKPGGSGAFSAETASDPVENLQDFAGTRSVETPDLEPTAPPREETDHDYGHSTAATLTPPPNPFDEANKSVAEESPVTEANTAPHDMGGMADDFGPNIFADAGELQSADTNQSPFEPQDSYHPEPAAERTPDLEETAKAAPLTEESIFADPQAVTAPETAPGAPDTKANDFTSLLRRVHGSSMIGAPGEATGEDASPPPDMSQISAAELAQRASCESVADLLAASAAWLTLARKQPRFSRREVMEVFEQLPGDHQRTLEARIKGYGKLVRSGTLVLIDDGVFAMSQSDRDRFAQFADQGDQPT